MVQVHLQHPQVSSHLQVAARRYISDSVDWHISSVPVQLEPSRSRHHRAYWTSTTLTDGTPEQRLHIGGKNLHHWQPISECPFTAREERFCIIR